MIQFEYRHKNSLAPAINQAIYFSDFRIGPFAHCQIITGFDEVSKDEAVIVHVKLEDGQLFLSSMNNKVFYINDKKILGTKKVLIGDIVKVNTTTLKVCAITPQMSETVDFQKKYREFLSNNEEYHSIIKSMEVELIHASDEICIPQIVQEKDK